MRMIPTMAVRLVSLSLLAASGASAQTCEAAAGSKCYYVAVNGSRTGSGSASAPFFYIEDGVSAARPGDFVYLRGGTYGTERAVCGGAFGPTTLIAIKDQPVANCPYPASAVSGTASAPITLKSYPGERAVLNGTGATNTIVVARKSFWTIQDLDITIAPVMISASSHDITIRNNNIHHMTSCCGNNMGMVTVYRSYAGESTGSYNINIENNVFHDLSEVNVSWSQTVDVAHFGGVTVLSCDDYDPAPCSTTGSITIRGNTLFNLPQAIYIKNPMGGPLLIQNNTIYNVQAGAALRGSNTTVERNVWYGVTWRTAFPVVGGFGGSSLASEPSVFSNTGHNLVVRYNTFVDFNSIAVFKSFASGHTITNNVVYGLNSHVVGAGWDSPSLVTRWISGNPPPIYNDTGGSNLSLSELNRNNTVNHNCLISPNFDFIDVKRMYWDYGTNNFSPISFLTLAQARQTFGFDTAGVFVQHATGEADKAAIFVDPAARDYRINPNGPAAGCGAMGAYAPGGSPPSPDIMAPGAPQGLRAL